MRVDNAGQRHPNPRDALDDPRIGGCGQAKPTIFLFDDAAEQPHLFHLFHDFLRIGIVVFELVGVGLHFLLEEAVDHVEHQNFLFVRLVIHYAVPFLSDDQPEWPTTRARYGRHPFQALLAALAAQPQPTMPSWRFP